MELGWTSKFLVELYNNITDDYIKNFTVYHTNRADSSKKENLGYNKHKQINSPRFRKTSFSLYGFSNFLDIPTECMHAHTISYFLPNFGARRMSPFLNTGFVRKSKITLKMNSLRTWTNLIKFNLIIHQFTIQKLPISPTHVSYKFQLASMNTTTIDCRSSYPAHRKRSFDFIFFVLLRSAPQL